MLIALKFKGKHHANKFPLCTIILLFVYAIFLVSPATYADAMKLSSSQPGNLWAVGKPEQFSCPVPDGVVSAQAIVNDYWGREVYNQPAKIDANKATISLPSFQLGWYTLTLTTNASSTNCTFGVVLQNDKATGQHDGKVCADAAAAWELKEAQYGEFADIVKSIGLPMVRERTRWNDVEPQQGVFTWGHYDNLINDYSSRGIAVDEIWCDTPEWAKSRPGSGTGIPPKLEDLRGFCLEVAKHYRGKVTAWEVWNEPDNHGIFFDGTPQEFYGVMAEAYKSLKEGSNGEAKVLQGAMCLKEVSPFARELFSMGAGKYTDAFNWHSYESSDSYNQILSNYRQACNLNAMPTWMTEAGIFLGTSPDGELSVEDAHRQCEYIPKSIARSLACGNTKHFFFILPYYNENGACLGALRKDLTPNPSVIALSAAAHLLGNCQYLRTVDFVGRTPDNRPTHAVAVYFSNPNGGQVVVAWADEKCVADYQGDAANIKVLNLFGGAETVASDATIIHLRLGTEPTFVLLPVPRSVFPFNETFSSEEGTRKMWMHTNNGGNSEIGGGFLKLTGNGSG